MTLDGNSVIDYSRGVQSSGLLLIYAATMALACGPTADGQTTETDATTGMVEDLCPEQSASDACCCFAKSDQSDNFIKNVCPAQPLCDQIKVLCDNFDVDPCPPDLLTTSSDAAIDCALQALVDGEAGALGWIVSGTMNPGQSGHEAVLLPVGDGTAFRTGYSFFDLGASVEAVSHFTLKPKDYFMDCLLQPTAAERFVCLREGREGTPIEGCIEAFDADYF